MKEDITHLEVDVIVNTTDPWFSGLGTLDRTVFKNGGMSMREACMNIGDCNEVSEHIPSNIFPVPTVAYLGMEALSCTM
jgi:O-acetyl-ADP-ribose deacetylase (regulator of RNase III)